MVRKKSDSFKKKKPFAPSGKLLMIERNKSTNSPQKTRKSSISLAGIDVNGSGKAGKSPAMLSMSKSEMKRKRLRPGTKALREIKKFQSNTSLLVPKASFSRLVREIMQTTFGKPDFRFSTMAMTALQEATEMAIVNLLEVANLCCIHARRVTLAPSDIRLTRRAFGIGHPVN